MTSSEKVRILPGRLCIGFLDEGGQDDQEENQPDQKREPAESLARMTESLQVGPHGGAPGPQETSARPGALT